MSAFSQKRREFLKKLGLAGTVWMLSGPMRAAEQEKTPAPVPRGQVRFGETPKPAGETPTLPGRKSHTRGAGGAFLRTLEAFK